MTAGLKTAPLALVLWFVIATIASATGVFARLHFPGFQLVILALVAVAIVAVTAAGPIREWVDALPWRALVGIHGLRLVGLWFLVLGARGLLAPSFASRAGWGDIVAAVVAIALAGVAAAPNRARGLFNVWNTFGVLDLIVAVATATVVTRQGLVPGIEPLTRLPLSLVPSFFVPVLLASHVVLYRRINAS